MKKIAWVFPGQGSQSIGMLSKYNKHTKIISYFNKASNILGYDLWDICQKDQKKIHQTKYTQPLLLTASIAISRILEERNEQKPDILAGHSLGEYSALLYAQSLSFSDAIKIVSFRGKCMEESGKDNIGGMAAILGLTSKEVFNICMDHSQGEILTPVNFNTADQIVISGHMNAIKRVIKKFHSFKKGKIILLPVSIPSHCILMQSASKKLDKFLSKIKIFPPKIPIIHNSDLQFHTEISDIKKSLILQMVSPVHWLMTIKKMVNLNVYKILECGPGKILTGINKKINKNLICQAFI